MNRKKTLKVYLILVGTSLIALGLRKISAVLRQQSGLELQMGFVMTKNTRSMFEVLFRKKIDTSQGLIPAKDHAEIAFELTDADVVGFSTMTEDANDTRLLINEIRKVNSGVFVIWGGAHAILNPEDAILYADAVCVNEGEQAVKELFIRFPTGNMSLLFPSC